MEAGRAGIRPRTTGWLMRDVRVVLIGGTSHVGKSTLARALAQKLGWSCVSTDRLGRHPGRPWPGGDGPVPAHVVIHYRTFPVEVLTTEQLRHYEQMWPVIRSLVDTHVHAPGAGRLVLEGSGVWPDRVVELQRAKVDAVWLTAAPETLRERIHAASGYSDLSSTEKALVDKFIGRTLRYQEIMMRAVRRLGLSAVDVDVEPAPGALVEWCLAQWA
jgi:shikimate kinase